jgi:hypothetical protein
MSVPNQTCQNCRYWLSGPTVGQRLRAAGATTTIQPPGFCTLSAPVAVTTPTGLPWPLTGGSESCGQWAAVPSS